MLGAASKTEQNLVPFIIDAARKGATLGEICDTLRTIFGEYQRPELF